MINESISLDDLTFWAGNNVCRTLQMLRLDAVHPIVSGNKWFKLKHNVKAALAQKKDSLLTFGGGYSNHLVATAFAAKEHGLYSVGIVKGRYDALTPTLRACADYGMRLMPFSNEHYRHLRTEEGCSRLSVRFPDAYIIPEGGANAAGMLGASEIAGFIPVDTTDVCVAIGTGTTLKGLCHALPPHIRLHGFYVAKDLERTETILPQVSVQNPKVIFHHVDDPRFGKWRDDAVQFIRTFYTATGIQLDVVYTSKMMMKLQTLLAENFFPPAAKIICIHTGGLQGNPAGLFSA